MQSELAEGFAPVFRITLAYFVRIGEQIQSLRTVSEGQELGDVRHIFYSSLQSFEEVLSNVVLSHSLRATYEPLRAVIYAIQGLNDDPDDNRMLDSFEAWELQDKLSKLYTVLSAELQVANAYLVLGKAAYDTRLLLLSGEQLFPEDLLSKVPDVLDDVRGAAKCLAYEMGTACGFHTLRAVEAVLNKYWGVVSGGLPLPEPRNMGQTINTMANQKLGSDKIRAALRQIKDLHRNPLMHPEEHLTVNQAISLVGMAQSCIGAMLEEIPDAKQPI